MIRPWCNKLGTALLLTACCIFLNMGGCDLFGWLPQPGDIVVDPPNICPSWDGDCDQISNDVETNGANAYLHLNPLVADSNPSIAHGYYYDGWIENALNLCDIRTGYSHYNPEADHDDWGVLHLLNMIEGAGRDWANGDFCPPRMGVGDLSWGDTTTRTFGGLWPGGDHSWRQNGLEVDIRYVRNDGTEAALNIRSDSLHYYRIATGMMLTFMFRNCVAEHIIISPYSYLGFDGFSVRYDSTGMHDDRFHFRIADPDGDMNRIMHDEGDRPWSAGLR